MGIDLALGRRARDGAALVEDAFGHRHGLGRGLQLGVGPGLLGQFGQAVLDRLQVGQDQLRVHRGDVGFGIDPAVHVDHVVVVEDPDHLADGVALADGGQELVPQPLPLRRAADDPGDVDEGHRSRHDRRVVVERGELRQAVVGHRHHPDVRIDGGEGVVGRQDLVVGQRVEERRLADVGQPDDADGEGHRRPLLRHQQARRRGEGPQVGLGAGARCGRSPRRRRDRRAARCRRGPCRASARRGGRRRRDPRRRWCRPPVSTGAAGTSSGPWAVRTTEPWAPRVMTTSSPVSSAASSAAVCEVGPNSMVISSSLPSRMSMSSTKRSRKSRWCRATQNGSESDRATEPFGVVRDGGGMTHGLLGRVHIPQVALEQDDRRRAPPRPSTRRRRSGSRPPPGTCPWSARRRRR